MLKNDFVFITLLVISIIAIIGILTLIILLSVLKKQSLKVKLKRSLFITLGVYFAFSIGVILTPITYLDTIRLSENISEGRAVEKDHYTNLNGKKLLTNYGKLTRFFNDYYKMIYLQNSEDTAVYKVFTNDNYDFIHFDYDFGEEYKTKKGVYYAKIMKPVGSCVFHTYFSFSKETYLRVKK